MAAFYSLHNSNYFLLVGNVFYFVHLSNPWRFPRAVNKNNSNAMRSSKKCISRAHVLISNNCLGKSVQVRNLSVKNEIIFVIFHQNVKLNQTTVSKTKDQHNFTLSNMDSFHFASHWWQCLHLDLFYNFRRWKFSKR